MYEFGTLIQIILTIISIYVAIYFSLKKNSTHKSFCMKEKKLNIITFFTIYVFIFIYLIPYVIKLITLLEDIFLTNSNFMFSYITEFILSIIAFCCFFYFLISEFYDDIFSEKHNLIIVILITFLCEIGLLWINYYLSLFISQNVMHNFIISSILTNAIIYFVISIPILFLIFPCLTLLDIINDGF